MFASWAGSAEQTQAGKHQDTGQACQRQEKTLPFLRQLSAASFTLKIWSEALISAEIEATSSFTYLHKLFVWSNLCFTAS